ncbi:hypothetical protein GF357_03130, partial [Candidatus Dojkabacteria bacterium]|nr:hypothetical protein [Candidatus Dojkabacteria bacterium]
MAISNLNSVQQQIRDFIYKHGGRYNDYYVGITDNIPERLSAHSIIAILDDYFSKDLEIEELARKVEAEFIELGCDGGDGGGKNPTIVYVYKKNSHT